MATERYDIVVFGASGFTGQFVVEEMAKVASGQGLTWAVSGRSMEKIQQVLNKASKRTGYKLSTKIYIFFFFSNVIAVVAQELVWKDQAPPPTRRKIIFLHKTL